MSDNHNALRSVPLPAIELYQIVYRPHVSLYPCNDMLGELLLLIAQDTVITSHTIMNAASGKSCLLLVNDAVL